MKKARLMATLGFAFSVVFVARLAGGSGNGLADSQPGASGSLPPGSWSLAFTPTVKPGPVVDVYRLSTSVERGLGVTKVSLQNRSDRTVTAVRLEWRLFAKEDPSNTLLSGETPLLGVVLRKTERRVVEVPVVSFAEIYKPLLTDGKVQGAFNIEVAATRAVFGDASEWHQAGPDIKSPVKLVSWSRSISPLEVDSRPDFARFDACQNQICAWNNDQHCWVCSGSDCFSCSPAGCQNCDNGRCSGGSCL